jgi:hypothetical protein
MKLAFRPPAWMQSIMLQYVPFADAASPELPLGRMFRLALFQLSIGITMALLVGTLNRVMIVELAIPAAWVAIAVALPLVFAPLRALIGYRSDTHPSALGLRRIPYMWMGSLLMFGGLAIMPFALMNLSEPREGYVLVGRLGAILAFLIVGAGIQITQTAGLALATDVSPEDKRPRVGYHGGQRGLKREHTNRKDNLLYEVGVAQENATGPTQEVLECEPRNNTRQHVYGKVDRHPVLLIPGWKDVGEEKCVEENKKENLAVGPGHAQRLARMAIAKLAPYEIGDEFFFGLQRPHC